MTAIELNQGVHNNSLMAEKLLILDKWGRKRLAYPIQKSKSLVITLFTDLLLQLLI
jgi:ribosomal protein S6